MTWRWRYQHCEDPMTAARGAPQERALLQWELSSLKGRCSRIPELERRLAELMQALNLAHQRNLALEAELDRLAQTNWIAATARLRDQIGALAGLLMEERAALAALRIEYGQLQMSHRKKSDESSPTSASSELRDRIVDWY